jgi:hypothetical protein
MKILHFRIAVGLVAACGLLAGGLAAAQPPSEAPDALPRVEDPAARARRAAELTRLRAARPLLDEAVLQQPGVIGTGIGAGDEGDDLVYNVFVRRSGPVPDLPAEIDGIPVRTRFRDPVRLLNGYPACGVYAPCHADRQDLPVEMGNSGGWISQTGAGACTLGFKACDLGTGRLVFVTNSHCNQSYTTCDLATPGSATDLWIHPGRMDVAVNPGTCLSSGTCEVIGEITGHAAPACGSNTNYTDATKVESDGSLTSNAFRDIGFAMAFAGDPMPGDLVRKSGRTTGDTAGEITNVDVMVDVPESGNGVDGYCCGALTMREQIEWLPIDSETKPGDSGSALLSLEPEFEFQVVGLNWGSDGTFSYANHVDHVLRALNLSLNFVSSAQDCAFTAAAETAQRSFATDGLVALGHRFRDQVLAETSVGRTLTQMYYRFSDEAVQIATRSPGLMLDTARLLSELAPRLEELVVNGRTTIGLSDLSRIDRLLEEYAAGAGDEMREAIATIRGKIADPEVQRKHGVYVRTPGERPAPQRAGR